MHYEISKTDQGITKYPLHAHNHFEIMYYLQGEGALLLEGGHLPFLPGTVIIVPPGIKHGSQAVLGFQNISVGGDFSNLFHISGPFVLQDNAAGDGRMLSQAIYRNRYAGEEYLDALCRAYACFLLQSLTPQDNTAQAVQAIVDTLSHRFTDPEINVTALLCQSGYAEDYIRARFHATTGLTPLAYLTRLRLDHARMLLTIYGRELSVSELAERCGFLDPVYFSKRFKQAFGCAPSQFHEKSKAADE